MKSSSKLVQWISTELFFIASVVSNVMFGVFGSEISKNMSLSPSMLGWLSGTFFITYSFVQFYSGRLFCIFPARIILFISALIAASGAFIFANSNSLVILFISRGLLGIGLASTFVGVLYIVQQNFTTKSFPIMSSLSQSTANCVAGIFGVVAGTIHNYHVSFNILGISLVSSALLTIIFIPMKKIDSKTLKDQLSLTQSCKVLLKNPQVWFASFFFTGLFSAVLTFSDLFNVSFQVSVFHESFTSSTIINAMIPFGLTIGGLLAGYWAQKINNYLLPARILSFIAVITFTIIIFVRFNEAYAFYITCGISFLFGIGCSSSILAFQCVQHNVKEVNLRPLANSIVLTFATIFSGLVEQPVVGDFISATELRLIGTPHSSAWISLFNEHQHDVWYKFNSGLYFILCCIICSFIFSLLFRNNAATTKNNDILHSTAK